MMQRQAEDHRPVRVLVVEDSRTQAEELRIVLESEGYSVDLAFEAEGGLELARSEPFDLVMSDILLPGMSGYELCRCLKGDPERRELPVVLLTSLKEPRALIQTLECGADGFVTKPYEPRYLLGRVKGILGERLDAPGDRQQLLGVLASAYEEAVRSRRQLEAKQRELLRIQGQKDELLAFMVHDLKNPLNDIATRLQLLQRKALGEREQQLVRMARTACASMDRMVLDLLDVGRAEDGQLRVVPEPLDVSEVVDEVVETMRLRAELERQEVRSTVPERIPVVADRALLVRVLENLVDNGLKYGPEGGRVEIAAVRHEDGAEIRISDEGPGVPDALKERVFDKYARLSDGDGRSRSSRGLGLTFARLAVEAHRGRIRVEDRDPKGSVFVLWLPRSPDAGASQGTSHSAPPTSTPPT